jgi:hypothetical protein
MTHSQAMFLLRTGVLLAYGALSACSADTYQAEIAGFGAGVDAVVTSYRSGQQAVDDIVAQQRLAADAAARSRVLLLPGCDQIDPAGQPPYLPDCDAVAAGAQAVSPPTPVQQNVAHAAPAFNALKAYATSVSAVAAAADDAALTRTAQSLAAAADGLAKVLAKPKPAAARKASIGPTDRLIAPTNSLIAPADSLITRGITLYLDQRRLAALRHVVPAADAAVQALGSTLQAALADIRVQTLLQLERGLRSAAEPLEAASVGRLSVADYQSRRRLLQTRIAAFNEARAADPDATVAALVKAHHLLALTLQAGNAPVVAPLTSVQAFVAAAGSLQAALRTATGAATQAPGATAR